MNNEFRNDDILFDRLVDGELSADERRTLLASLDTRADGWRKCALAFLEAQSWRNEVKSLAARPNAATATKSAAPSVLPKRTRFRTAAQWLALAAGLLVAFELGTLDRGPAPQQVVDGSVKTNEQLADTLPAAGAAAPNAAKPGDALNLWVRDDAGELRRVRVPLVDASSLGYEYGLEFQTGVPDDVRSRLQDHGYSVQSKRQYAPMWLDNGRQMIVPVEDTRIVPVGSNVY
jgi:anti-sigma factor RsiW